MVVEICWVDACIIIVNTLLYLRVGVQALLLLLPLYILTGLRNRVFGWACAALDMCVGHVL